MGKTNNHILVTGCPRSGTTFLGTALALPARVGYIREPFNRDFGLEGLQNDFTYLYVGMKEEQTYRDIITQLLRGDARFRRLSSVDALRKRQKLGRAVFGGGSNYSYVKAKYNPIINRYLLKDPMASLASQYLSQEFDIRPVMIVRHPIPTITSMQRVGIRHPIEEFAGHKDLRRKYLASILSGVQLSRLSLLEEQALLWTCVNAILAGFSKEDPSFIVVRHEDVSQDPHTTLTQLYHELGLVYSNTIKRRIDAMTNASNPIKVSNGKMHVLSRNSRALTRDGYSDFSTKDKKTIAAIASDVARLFYPSAGWPLATS